MGGGGRQTCKGKGTERKSVRADGGTAVDVERCVGAVGRGTSERAGGDMRADGRLEWDEGAGDTENECILLARLAPTFCAARVVTWQQRLGCGSIMK